METKEMTKEAIIEYLNDTKILCTSDEESKKVQEKIFELGIGWAILGKSVANKYLLFINDNRIEFTPDIDFWVRSDKKRIEPSEILAIQIKEEKPKFDPNTLEDFQKVLYRDANDELWCLSFFDIYKELKFFVITEENPQMQCVPYNEETKHLKGTTEEAPEFYNIWK